MVEGAEWILLVAAAFAAGAVNAVAGGGSLLSFPALLAVGLGPVAANVTNMLAVLPGYLGGSVAYRRELRGQGARARALGLVSALGAAAGAALLLAGDEDVFEALAPWLILLASAALALRPSSRLRGGRAGLLALVALGAVYGGYFGAGLGIMLLAVLRAFLPDDLQRLNALKGLLSLVIALVGALVVAVFGPVEWGPAAVMAGASLLGGHAGVGVARRLPEPVLRWGIVVFGVGVGLALLG